jgi:Domain of unknown function (DUF4145)
MLCPSCLQAFHPQPQQLNLQGNDADWLAFYIEFGNCPACNRRWVLLKTHRGTEIKESMVYPRNAARRPVSLDVPSKFADDYKEACAVLADSPKASAALSRRCLQRILREQAKVKTQDLSKEIDEILASKQLPSSLTGAIDAVRNLGNFAAHPIKSTSTGEIVDVEPGEADWLLDTLDGLFDFYFVGPAELQRKRDALNKKLTDAGKPPLK